MGLSKEEANLYEEKLDRGRILLLVTDETLTASDNRKTIILSNRLQYLINR